MATHLIVFVKNPVPGAVKTRLRPRCTPLLAARLSRAFILDTFESLSAVPAGARIACFSPSGAENAVRGLCGEGWALQPQGDGDLGGRMHRAFRRSFEAGASRAVLVGTDIPSLPVSHVRRAVARLGRHDVVLGPSTDGGYYLVGLRRPAPVLFHGIPWSTSLVFERTVAKVRDAGLSLALVPPWYDVDTPAHLGFLAAHVAAEPPCGHRMRHTRALLPLVFDL